LCRCVELCTRLATVGAARGAGLPHWMRRKRLQLAPEQRADRVAAVALAEIRGPAGTLRRAVAREVMGVGDDAIARRTDEPVSLPLCLRPMGYRAEH
jgi:hypothetical protein